MYAFLIVVHVLICLLLIAVILIQSGRGGGLLESFSSAESIFGTKTNTFLIRATSILAILFLLTCVSLTFLSVKRGRSLISTINQEKETNKSEKK